MDRANVTQGTIAPHGVDGPVFARAIITAFPKAFKWRILSPGQMSCLKMRLEGIQRPFELAKRIVSDKPAARECTGG